MSELFGRMVVLLAVFVVTTVAQGQTVGKPAANVLILVGPSTHPPGTHEVAAGGRLVAHCLLTRRTFREFTPT